MGWDGLVLIGLERVMGSRGEDVKLGLRLSCDWAIVCGVCYYPKLLQMRQLHPNPRPRLVMTNSADNTR